MTDQPGSSPSPPVARPDTPAEARDDRLVTFFQPFYNLLTGRMQGLEALARRRSETDGSTESPAGFFAEAQASGRMRDIDLRILDDALAHVARWSTQPEHAGLILSVNLSGDLVGHPSFVTDMTAALRRHGLPEDQLLVDITTETFRRVTSGDAEALTRLRRLQQRGVSFCLDGFTAADLDILPAALDVPVDIIKLLPRQLAAGADQLAGLAKAVQQEGLPVVAAGVETSAQLALVRELGFEWVQGYLLGEPVEGDRALDYPAELDR
ncbi:EAL domain-containing protein [Agilicoccus flavus]|uniref:EAL domain-containing protein n=1 Tax=Agilicoccus flavus TaxID=2775968 RepID=UPI001CF61E3F|nr:EAL domain-containing protein [Agilicoccus flavus]